MKNFLPLFTCLLFFCGCQEKKEVKNVIVEPITDNDELQQIHDEDQGDRKTATIDWSIVGRRDSMCQKRVYEMLDSNLVRTGRDYHNAAMIFQHGLDTIASGMAVKLMKKAIEIDTTENKWLLAAAIDRDLMYRGKPQVYGTQYRRDNKDTPWYWYEKDTTVISDEERIEYKVGTLAEQRERMRRMNQKAITELIAAGKSIEEIIIMAKLEYDDPKSQYNFSESALNSLAYQEMGSKNMEDALKFFLLNTELYPEGFNAWDSLGEFYMSAGEKDKAVACYQKSYDLNSKNTHAKEMIEEMTK